MPRPSPLRRALALIGWNRHSLFLFSAFVLVCALIVYAWRPLAEEYLALVDWNGEWWRYMDWLLIGIWLAMSLLIMAGADLRRDAAIVFVGTIGGLVIEAWGTQTNLWFYYTAERPPLWIIPAWPIASLAIDRLTRLMEHIACRLPRSRFTFYVSRSLYWLIFLPFFTLLLAFTAPTFDKPLTLFSLLICMLLIATPTDHRRAVLIFLAGAGLGYFLELWGTTRECWTYYTRETPPFFAVLAHGMAAVAFWRAGLILARLARRLRRTPAAVDPENPRQHHQPADHLHGVERLPQ